MPRYRLPCTNVAHESSDIIKQKRLCSLGLPFQLEVRVSAIEKHLGLDKKIAA
jgi:hypothetical protein